MATGIFALRCHLGRRAKTDTLLGQFLFGTAVVIYATYLYSKPELRPSGVDVAKFEKITVGRDSGDQDRGRPSSPLKSSD